MDNILEGGVAGTRAEEAEVFEDVEGASMGTCLTHHTHVKCTT